MCEARPRECLHVSFLGPGILLVCKVRVTVIIKIAVKKK